MATIPHPATCRSCTYYVSDAASYPDGVCSNEASPAFLEPVTVRDSCYEHDGYQQFGDMAGMVLIERECTVCEHSSVYSLDNKGVERCASPACPTNR